MNQFFKKVISRSTLYYTFTVVAFSFIVLVANASEETVSVDPSRILYFLPFCICFAIANTFLQYKTVEAVTRWAVHFVLTATSAFLFIILPAKLNTGSGNFMGMIFIIAIYLIGALFSAILSSRIKKSLQQDSELKSKASKSNK